MKERFLARIVDGYRITVPPLVRRRLELTVGDVVEVEISGNTSPEKKEVKKG